MSQSLLELEPLDALLFFADCDVLDDLLERSFSEAERLAGDSLADVGHESRLAHSGLVLVVGFFGNRLV